MTLLRSKKRRVDATLLTTTERELPDEDTPMIEAEELEASEVAMKKEDEDNDAMLNTIKNTIRVTEIEEKAAAESENVFYLHTSSPMHIFYKRLPSE